MQKQQVVPLPKWVPVEVSRYLDHTEAGRSIRQLARSAGCHPSTVLRQVRKIETRRDDPLVEGALYSLACNHYAGSQDLADQKRSQKVAAIRDEVFDQDAVRVLHGLCRAGTVLAVAEGMNKAVVVREADARITRKEVVERPLAEALALRDWISCTKPCRLSRYHITASGRTVVRTRMAEAENMARAKPDNGFFEAQANFANQNSPWRAKSQQQKRARYGWVESPLETLARLNDQNGQPFLTPELVSAGGRLREDFELAQIGDQVVRDRAQFEKDCGSALDANSLTAEAKKRAVTALNHLGPGLSDIALRCCCHLEGLEQAERHLGWSARSGKIVLRIALQQLKSYYETQSSDDVMIG